MEQTDAIETTDAYSTEQWLPVLLLLFVGSGCAALIYEIVWFQMLELFVGSSSVSIGVLLGTFMGGMCLGSFLLPRFISPRHHPLKVYALPRDRDRRHRPAAALRAAARWPRVHGVGRLRHLPGICCAASSRASVCCRRRWRWVRRFRPWRAGCRRPRPACRGWAFSTPGTSRAPSWARCSLASICCACST